MAKILILYYSETGNTKKMAEFISLGVKEENVDVVLKNITDTSVKELLDYEGIIIGSPTYYGLLSYQVKKFIDESVILHGQLEGKVGGAFSSSFNPAGGNETTIISIIQAMLVHGMIVKGSSKSNHYGPVSIGEPDTKVEKECREYGKMIAKLVKSIKK